MEKKKKIMREEKFLQEREREREECERRAVREIGIH